jgi:hypothetical protein
MFHIRSNQRLDLENITSGKIGGYDFVYKSEINRYSSCRIIISNRTGCKYTVDDNGGARTGIVMSLGERTYNL